MVALNRIYTKSGDKGRTSLVSGVRVFKHDLRIQAIGDVDETNCFIGLARQEVDISLDPLLSHIQNDLFDLGADLATPLPKKKIDLFPFDGKSSETNQQKSSDLRIIESQVTFLEKTIDEYNEKLSPLTSFILPGGSKAATTLHLARAVTRRAERSVVSFMQDNDVNPWALKYLNRLSDLLFVLCRHVNDNGKRDVLWKPGANR